jgi:Lrp/AsnC family transcriptional regulator, leucine-responsive regulatory protein
MNTLDQIDNQILALLQADARTTQAQIAARVGLSQPAVAERVHKLEASGIIRGYTARIDPKQVGQEVRAFIGVSVDHPRYHESFAKRVRSLPEVLECHRVAGLDSYLLKVMTRNTESLDRLICDHIRRIPGVTRTHTTVVLSSIKEEALVPLPELGPSGPRKKEGGSRA